ncbi:hypothetical protein BD324DRAFT_612065 [Kockovaella imperatae]|uniref:Uncharacterized protein n=1 Tax=Kockovaella imperatae TaxID=4999 RepID=A0A1Y1US37_9TREE|nr:hypothetical protein BD324DRAFT_612065 [Kockovaella imperatae]ORX40772.1 hypothetical protein BD324DRAFT_612065 [Kockovaella imperatae]
MPQLQSLECTNPCRRCTMGQIFLDAGGSRATLKGVVTVRAATKEGGHAYSPLSSYHFNSDTGSDDTAQSHE